MADVVVLGAGPTGLATAMLLAGQGLDTVVLERDEAPPDDPEKAWESWERRGVAQFRQAHLVQGGGYALIRDHLSAVVSGLEEVGAIPFNSAEPQAALLPGGAAGIDFTRFKALACRRPLIDYAFGSAARATPGVDVRYGTAARELLTGSEAIRGVPHVVGVRTTTGEAVPTRLVVDASGRRTPLPAMLESVGGRRPEEHGVDIGFAYGTQFYQGSEIPEIRGDLNAEVGSFTVLTIPADHGWWSVTLYYSAHDKAMRRVRDRQVFERVVRSLPLHAHWLDGKPQGPVRPMSSTVNATRDFVVDGLPCATGVIPVGDAWGFTNPSIGRGVSFGLMHAVDLAPTIVAHVDDPVRLAGGWAQTTEENAAPWHEATVDYDRIRGAEVDAYRRQQPDPFASGKPAVAQARAFTSASHYDPQVLQWYYEVISCMTRASEVFSRDGVRERVLEVAGSNPRYLTPGPDRAELEALLV
jgi:flavin-dependent dehydrogenase